MGCGPCRPTSVRHWRGQGVPFRRHRDRRRTTAFPSGRCGNQHSADGRGFGRAGAGAGRSVVTGCPHRLGPAVGAPSNSIEQDLAAQRPEAIFIAVIDHSPLPARPFEQRRMAARPPFFARRGGAEDGIAGVGIETGEGDVVILASAQQRRIWVIAANTGLRNVPSPRSARSWPSKPLPHSMSANGSSDDVAAEPCAASFSCGRTAAPSSPRAVRRSITGSEQEAGVVGLVHSFKRKLDMFVDLVADRCIEVAIQNLRRCCRSHCWHL